MRAYADRLHHVATTAPNLLALIDPALEGGTPPRLDGRPPQPLPKLSIVIPAYNEADNIRDCVISVLESSTLPVDRLEVWVIDDQSTDATLSILQSLQAELNDSRLQVLAGAPRPDQPVWVGKNWACTQAMEHVQGDFLLFLDADVRLRPQAIARSLQAMQQLDIDLLTLCPAIVCGCLAEWLVQPLIASLLLAGFDFNQVNDPASETAFAVGPFMLFRRSAYDRVGGHQAVAGQVVEDVELAQRIKQMGLKLLYAPGRELASVRMYRSWAAVWEGWTKNWHLGSRRSIVASLYSAAIIALGCVVPWLGLAWSLMQSAASGFTWMNALAGGLALIAIGLQYTLRQSVERVTAIPLRYWWLTGVGGLLVTAIILSSIIKTETGWGWTWRGRSLKLPKEPATE